MDKHNDNRGPLTPSDSLVNKIRLYMPFIISALIVIAAILRRMVTIKHKRGVDTKDIILDFLFTAAILVIMHIIWRPAGKYSVKTNVNGPFYKNTKRYGELVTGVDSNKKTQKFKTYCEKKNAALITLKEDDMLKSVGLSREEYEVYVNDKCAPIFTKKQLRVLNKIHNGKVKVKTINSLTILTDRSIRNKYDYGVSYNEFLYDMVEVSIKILQKLVTALVIGYITYDKLSNGFTVDIIMDLIMNLILIIMSAWGGYTGGEKQYSVYKNNVIKCRIKLIEEFYEEEGIALPNNGN